MKKRRLAIYFFYDKEGIVDRYIDYFLEGLTEVVQEFVIVCNGVLSPAGRQIFQKYTKDILVRPNKGLDVWAYKTALDFVGWEQLRTYDEVILLNHTIMGPVYPFSEMFDKMAQKEDLDFWGVNVWQPGCYRKGQIDNFCNNPYGYLPEHLQSHFIVYRKRFLETRELKEYWDTVPEIHNYLESVGFHESYFTRHFSDMGFLWDCYVSKKNDLEYGPYYLFDNPVRALEKDRCPFFKRKSFFYDPESYLIETMAEQPAELFRYLQEHTNYDVTMILENIIRTCHPADFVHDMNLNYILPDSGASQPLHTHPSVALIAYINHLDLLQDTMHYLSALPAYVDIWINTSLDEDLDTLRNCFSILPNRLSVHWTDEEGGYVSALLAGSGKIVPQYDYVCLYQDIKDDKITPLQSGRSFAYLQHESILRSRGYVENILSAFETNPYLGMLCPVVSSNSEYNGILGNEWGKYYDTAADLAEKLDLHVPISPQKCPIFPCAGNFWFRTKAMKSLFENEWRYKNFKKNTRKGEYIDANSMERVWPMIVQNHGFYPAYVLPEFLAGLELSRLRHYVQDYNRVLYRYNEQNGAYTHTNSHHGMISILERALFPEQISSPGDGTESSTPQAQTIVSAVDASTRIVALAKNPPYSLGVAIKLFLNRHIPFLFRKAAQRIPPRMRVIGVRDALKIHKLRRILDLQ